MKLQCVVTSYRRPKYLKPCLESMRHEDIELYVVDGGSDEETLEYIRKTADGYHFMRNNPGADVLKNEGINRFVKQPHFLISSDDLLFPKDWRDLVLRQWEKLQAVGYVMVASPMEYVVREYKQDYRLENDVPVLRRNTSMVAGTMMDLEAARRVGLFPVYGKTGEGDWAICRRFARLGKKVGYFLRPELVHLGEHKHEDYPEYSAAYKANQDIYKPRAKADAWKPGDPV